MANEIENHLRIIGEEKDINEVFGYIKNEDDLIDFNKIIPIPEDMGNIYGWKSSNWDTADPYNQSKLSADRIRFMTRWNAPIAVIIELSKIFPKVKVELIYNDTDTIVVNETKYVYEKGLMTFYEKHEKYDPEEMKNSQ